MTSGSLRSLAEKLGVSHATVSAALSGKPNVKPSTRARILAAAKELGYRTNPLASALMGELRRSRGGVFRGTLALISLASEAEEKSSAHALYEQAVIHGAARRAEQLGFKLDRIRFSQADSDWLRPADTITARGIRGVLLTHEAGAHLARRLDWSHLTGLLLGFPGSDTGLNVIGPDHHTAMACALDRLQTLGYSRPGLVLDDASPASIRQRWKSAYLACRPDLAPTTGSHIFHSGPPDRARFRRWLSDGHFDVVLAQHPRILQWMREGDTLHPLVPAFCSLDLCGAGQEVTGLDLRAAETGAHATDLLAGQVLRNETGLPEFPIATLIPPAWIPGRTLRIPDARLHPHFFELATAQEKLIA